ASARWFRPPVAPQDPAQVSLEVACDGVDLTSGDAHSRHEIRLRETAPVLDELIERAASPAWAGVAVQRLRDGGGEVAARLAEDVSLATALVTVASASRSLTELCLSEPAAIDVLADLDLR